MSESGAQQQRVIDAVELRRLLRRLAITLAPPMVRAWIRERLLAGWPPVGRVRFGSLRRARPIDREFGYHRGLPADRYYIESFLAKHRRAVEGRVLEVGDNEYTKRFGADQVTCSDVLHPAGNEWSTLVGDLSTGEGIPSDAFQCIILTQVLHHIYDVKAAIRHSYRALQPGGVLLATLPGITKICRNDFDTAPWGDYWRFTSLSARLLFEETFAAGNVDVEAAGNVLTAIAFLHGIAAQELKRHELDYHDPDYEVLITVRAVKPGDSSMKDSWA
jgi:SAM-dependent methyltransferase